MGKGSTTPSTFEYYQTIWMLGGSGQIKRIRRIWFDADVVYDDRPEQAGWASRPMTADGRRPALAAYLKSENIEVQLGTQVQMPPVAIEALLGSDNAYALRGRWGVCFKDAPLHKTGGRIPSISIEAESADADENGKSDLVFILNDALDQGDFPGSSWRDFSQLDGIKVDGFLLADRSEARQHLAPLQDAFFFDLVDEDFKLLAKKRGTQTPVGTFNRDHMGAGTPDPQAVPFELTRGQQADVPQKADVVYQSAAIDYQNFTQTTNREATLLTNADVLQLPVVMSENDAMAVARRRLAVAQVSRDPMKLYMVPCGDTDEELYAAWGPGDTAYFPEDDGQLTLLRITKQLIGLFGHIEFDTVPDDPDNYFLTGEGAADPGTGGGGVQEAWPPVIYVADINALYPSPNQSFDGCNIIVIIGSARPSWGGATARSQAGVRSIDGSVKHTLTTNTLGGTLGNLVSTLGAWRGPNIWDDDNSIVVQLLHVLVATATANGGNVGNGIIEMGDPSTSGGVIEGTYLATFTDATHFTVTDPTSAVVGTGHTGTQFATEVVFKITAGSTAFHAGDVFTVLVVAMSNAIGTPPVGSTDLDVLNGANALIIEGEIIQYASAIDEGADTYRLTRLLRGRQGTDYIAWNDHAAGAVVAFLPSADNSNIVQQFKAKLSEVGNTKTVNAWDLDKADASYSNTPSTQVAIAGNCRRPWGPGGVTPVRNSGTNDVAIDWEYRSRYGTQLDDGGTGLVALGETAETYDLEIWDSTLATLKRTVSALTVSNWTYTAAMQVADFGAAPARPFGLILYQVSSVMGRGFPSRTVVTV